MRFHMQYLTKLKNTLRDSAGSAALEFAILLPLMFLLFVASIELSQALMASRNAEELARTLADLTSRESTTTVSSTLTSYPLNATTAIPVSDLTMILGTDTAVMQPFPTANLTMSIVAVDLNNATVTTCCVATVRWYVTNYPITGGTQAPQPCGQPLTPQPATSGPSYGKISSAIAPSNQTTTLVAPAAVFIATVTYTYTPILTYPFNFAPTTVTTQYSYPRNTGQVIINTPAPGAISDGTSLYGKVCY
jgi:Flp pilus assembly protein TadG